jgi:hypothetical protein
MAAGVRFAISLEDPWIVANRERGMPLSVFWKLWKNWFTIELVHGQQTSKKIGALLKENVPRRN